MEVSESMTSIHLCDIFCLGAGAPIQSPHSSQPLPWWGDPAAAQLQQGDLHIQAGGPCSSQPQWGQRDPTAAQPPPAARDPGVPTLCRWQGSPWSSLLLVAGAPQSCSATTEHPLNPPPYFVRDIFSENRIVGDLAMTFTKNIPDKILALFMSIANTGCMILLYLHSSKEYYNWNCDEEDVELLEHNNWNLMD
ncbi:hypothetical protein KIL84_021055 [Mauremys mutica]|uniref:Uncharacterized protein n=1 Tax=Mauremys mutica TaxID=74926 RepID=A0A9D3XB18_9SAUR|nr:hypothetical protein KIL84_021055 [Mauremys mutica]